MRIFDRFDSVVFDCDGVLLDSNDLKIQAMRDALARQPEFSEADIDRCIQDFRAGFGKSRFHHIERFAKSVARHNDDAAANIETRLLEAFSTNAEEAYVRAPVIHGVLTLLEKLAPKKLFVASGSEQDQLRRVLRARNMSDYFLEVYGSPESKQENLITIIQKYSCKRSVLVGDSSADFEAAHNVGIQFIYFSPYSNEKEQMETLRKQYKFPTIDFFAT